MKISNITNQAISFRGSIIDSHVHRGTEHSLWNSKEFPTSSLDEFIKSPMDISVQGTKQTDNVIKVLVSSIDGLAWSEEQRKNILAQGKSKYSLKPEEVEFSKNEYSANLDMINKFKQNNFYAVMAVCQPSKTNGSADTIRRLIKENPDAITGLKFHPQDLLLNADSGLYDDYLKLADEMKLPCLFHSQVNIDYAAKRESANLNWADPEYIYALAKRHPNVPVIMAHMGAGGDLAHKKAIRVLEQSIKNNDAKLYVDISWVDFNNDLPAENPQNILDVIEKMKNAGRLDRILFGTDAPLGCYGEPEALKKTNLTPKQAYELTVSRLKTAIKNRFKDEADMITEKIFYENSNELFFEKNWAAEKAEKAIVKQRSKGKIAAAAGTVAAISAIVYGVWDYKQKDKKAK